MARCTDEEVARCIGCGSTRVVPAPSEAGITWWCECGRPNSASQAFESLAEFGCPECGQDLDVDDEGRTKHCRYLKAPKCSIHKREKVMDARARMRLVGGRR